MSLISKAQEKLFTLIGDLALTDWKHPFWIVYSPVSHKFKGEEYLEMVQLIFSGKLRPGDLLLRKFDGYLDTYFIPGDLNHGGIYVGDYNGEKYQVIHSMSQGVFAESIFDFMRTDHFCILRPNNTTLEEAKEAKDCAISCIGRPYDFSFRYTDHWALYCTELLGFCWKHVSTYFKFKLQIHGFGPFKREALTADDIFLSDCTIIFMTKSILKMNLWKKRVNNTL